MCQYPDTRRIFQGNRPRLSGASAALLSTLAMSLVPATETFAAQDVPGQAVNGQPYGPPRPDIVSPSPDIAKVGPVAPGIPSTLHELAVTTSATHPQVKSVEGRIRAAGYDVRGAKWLRFPSLTVEALAITKGSVNAAQDGTVLNAVIEQPIWAGGRIGAAIDRAKAQLLVQRAGLDEVARDLSLRVVQAYFEIAAAARRTEILKDALARHRELSDTIGRRVEQQISPRSDLDLAMARAAQIEQQLALAQAQRSGAVNTLSELTGDANMLLGDVPAYDPALHHPSEVGAVAKALACDPRSARLSAESVVARAEQKSAKAALLPQLIGQLSSNEVLGERVGLALRAQTGNGLSQAAAAQGAGERAQASEQAIVSAQRELREALRLDFVNNSAARQRIGSAATAATSSLFVVESYKRQFIAGRRTWLDVMNALQESTNMRLATVDSETSAQLTTARIALRTCTWQPRLLAGGTEPNHG